jgi:hypothetical protein
VAKQDLTLRPLQGRRRIGELHKGDEVQIDVSHNPVYDDRLWDKGWDALRVSYNDTVRSEI